MKNQLILTIFLLITTLFGFSSLSSAQTDKSKNAEKTHPILVKEEPLAVAFFQNDTFWTNKISEKDTLGYKDYNQFVRVNPFAFYVVPYLEMVNGKKIEKTRLVEGIEIRESLIVFRLTKIEAQGRGEAGKKLIEQLNEYDLTGETANQKSLNPKTLALFYKFMCGNEKGMQTAVEWESYSKALDKAFDIVQKFHEEMITEYKYDSKSK